MTKLKEMTSGYWKGKTARVLVRALRECHDIGEGDPWFRLSECRAVEIVEAFIIVG